MLVLGLGMVASSLTILLPVSLGKAFGLLFGYHSLRAQIFEGLPASWVSSLPNFLGLLVVMILLRALSEYGERSLTGRLGEAFSRYLREHLFAAQLKLPLSIYQSKGTGRYLLRWSGDLKSLQNWLTKGIIRFGRDVLFLMGFLVVMYQLHPSLCAWIVLGLLLSGFGIHCLNHLLYQISVERRNRKSGLLAFVSQRLLAIESLLVFNRQNPESKRFQRRSERLYQSGRAYHRIFALIQTSISTLVYLLLVGLLAWAYLSANAHSSEQLLGAFLLMITVMPVLRRLFRVRTHWELGRISLVKLQNILSQKVEESSLDSFHLKTGTIQWEGVSFDIQDRRVFGNANIHLQGQQTHWIDMGNGLQSRSFVYLTAGVYMPAKGELWIDGQSTKTVNAFQLRKKIAVASTHFPLFGKTVFQAVSYSRKKEKRQRVEELLMYLQFPLPEEEHLSLDDPIGELGQMLSPAQRRLLVLVRALLTNKPILILENPFQDLPLSMHSPLITLLNTWHGQKTMIVLSQEQKMKEELLVDHYMKWVE